MNRPIKFHVSFILPVVLLVAMSGCKKDSPPGAAPSQVHLTPQAPIPALPAQQNEGGVDGGGGNFVKSDPKDIEAIFSGRHGFDLKDTVKQVFRSLSFQVQNKFIEPRQESIFSVMLGPTFSGDAFDVFQDIDRSPYQLKKSGSCLDESSANFKDAGTAIGKKSAPICFSLEGLSQIPIQAVPFQLVALAVHEHAHHYGFDEADALLAQQQVLEVMNRGLAQGLFMDALSTAASIREHTKRMLERLSPQVPDKIICKNLSALNASAERLVELDEQIKDDFETRMIVTALNFQHGLKKNSLDQARDLEKLVKQTLSFCGDDPFVNASGYAAEEGSRKELRVLLNEILALATKITAKAAEYSNEHEDE